MVSQRSWLPLGLDVKGGNEFEGTAHVTHATQDFILAKPLNKGDKSNFENYLAQQAVLNLGGPLKKDKLWFFASVQGDRAVTASTYPVRRAMRLLEAALAE